MLELITNQRLRLALRILDSIYSPGVTCTDAEISALKRSYRRGDTAGMILEDIATAVIHEELDRIRTAPAEYVEKRPAASLPARKPVASEYARHATMRYSGARIPFVRRR